MLKSGAAPTGLAPLLPVPVPSSFLPSLAASRRSCCCPSLLACQGMQGCSRPASNPGIGHRGAGGTMVAFWGAASPCQQEGTCDRPVGQAGWHWLSFALAVNPLVPPVGAPPDAFAQLPLLSKESEAATAPWLQEAGIPGNTNLLWLPGSSPCLQLAAGACVGSQPSAAKVTH